MVIGTTQEQRNQAWAAKRRAHFARGLPTRMFAWRPVERNEDGRTVWLEHVWRVILIHKSGSVFERHYFTTREAAQVEYDRWQEILKS